MKERGGGGRRKKEKKEGRGVESSSRRTLSTKMAGEGIPVKRHIDGYNRVPTPLTRQFLK